MSNDQTVLTFSMEADAYPLDEKVVLRSGVAAFESQLALIPNFPSDYAFLSSIKFGTCFYGASDWEIYPFLCVPKQPFTDIPTAAQIISELRVANFQSEHIATLDARNIPYPGYHPNTKNDEIHTDAYKQYMFAKKADVDEDTSDSSKLSWASHEELIHYVLNHHLFYVLIHDKPKQHGDYLFSNYVLLFALGVSPDTGNLVGAISNQVCHNLCD